MSATEAPSVLMHLDGCHFFVWVTREPNGHVELSYDERTGENLYLHASDEPCERCAEGLHGLHIAARVLLCGTATP